MTEEPEKVCKSLHSNGIVNNCSESSTLPSIGKASHAKTALSDLKRELFLGPRLNYVNELMIHSEIGRGKKKSDAARSNSTHNFNLGLSEEKCSKSVPNAVEKKKVNKQNGTLKNMDTVKDSNYKKLSNGVEPFNNRPIKRKPIKMNRYNNVSAPLQYKTFENGVFPPPPPHFAMQPNIKHFRPKEPQLYYAKPAIPTLQKQPFPGDMDRIIYSKPRPTLCPPQMFDASRYYLHRGSYTNNKPELQGHVACSDAYSFSANTAYRKQPLPKEAIMEKKMFYNNTSNNVHMKHFIKDNSVGHYNKMAMNSARGPMAHLKHAGPPLEKVTYPCTYQTVNSSNTKFSHGGEYLLKCDTYPKKDTSYVAMEPHGKARYMNSQVERKAGNSNNNSEDNSRSVLRDWSLLCKDELSYTEGNNENYVTSPVQDGVMKVEAECDSSSHTDLSGKKLLHSNSDLQGTSVCSSDSGIETTASFSEDKKVPKHVAISGTIAKTPEDFPELGGEKTALPVSLPNFCNSGAPKRKDMNLCEIQKLSDLPTKKKMDEESNDLIIEGKTLSDKLVLSPDSSFPESSETLASLSTRTDSVLSDSSSICSSSNSSMFKLENRMQDSNIPPVIIMENCMPSENITGISFGIEINEMLEICAKSSVTPEEPTKVLPQEFSSLEFSENEAQDGDEVELCSPKYEKNVFPVRGKMFQFKDSMVDTGRCNLSDIMGFLQNSWNLVQKADGNEEGNLSQANFCVIED